MLKTQSLSCLDLGYVITAEVTSIIFGFLMYNMSDRNSLLQMIGYMVRCLFVFASGFVVINSFSGAHRERTFKLGIVGQFIAFPFAVCLFLPLSFVLVRLVYSDTESLQKAFLGKASLKEVLTVPVLVAILVGSFLQEVAKIGLLALAMRPGKKTIKEFPDVKQIVWGGIAIGYGFGLTMNIAAFSSDPIHSGPMTILVPVAQILFCPHALIGCVAGMLMAKRSYVMMRQTSEETEGSNAFLTSLGLPVLANFMLTFFALCINTSLVVAIVGSVTIASLLILYIFVNRSILL